MQKVWNVFLNKSQWTFSTFPAGWQQFWLHHGRAKVRVCFCGWGGLQWHRHPGHSTHEWTLKEGGQHSDRSSQVLLPAPQASCEHWVQRTVLLHPGGAMVEEERWGKQGFIHKELWMQQFTQLLISASQFLSAWCKYSIAVLPNSCPVILPVYSLLLRVGRACRSLKMGVGEMRRLCFLLLQLAVLWNGWFFSLLFQNSEYLRNSEGIRIKPAFFKGCVWKEMLWAIGFSTA